MGVVTPPKPGTAAEAVPAISGVMLAALTAFVLVFGVYPAPLIHLIERAVSTLP